MIAIINYGVGNLQSILEILKRANVECEIVDRAEQVAACDRIILPGVGQFRHCMDKLTKSPLYAPLKQAVFDHKKPVLGICVGMQMLATSSEEGSTDGLGWISGAVKKFPTTFQNQRMRVPHVGWNRAASVVGNKKADNLLPASLDKARRYYYTHSYYFEVTDPKHLLATSFYGLRFGAVINKDNIYGVQFHPEKSHDDGMELLRNFSTFTSGN